MRRPAAGGRVHGLLHRVIDWPVQFARDWLLRFVDLQGFDRAVALAGQAFTALIPLLIVYSSIVSRRTGRDFADKIIRTFELKGATAATVKQAIASPSQVESTLSVLGALILVFSALAFTRALQRLYQIAWKQPPLGLRAAEWGLLWLLLLVGFVTLRPWVLRGMDGTVQLVVTIGLNAGLWVLTPYILLARRVPWRRLLATGVMTSIGMTTLAVCSAIWMPHTLASSAEAFGTIGVAFALLSWLVGGGLVLVVATAGGAVVDARMDARNSLQPA